MAANGSPRSKGLLFLLLRILATVLLVAFVLRAVPLGQTLNSLRTLALWAVAWAVVAELAMRVASIVRWHLLLAPAGVRVPLTETLRLGFIALFYNNFMPSTVGGDVAKSYLAVRGRDCSPAAVVASVLVDRAVVGWGSLVLFGLVLSAFLDTPQYQMAIVVLLGGGLVAAVLVILLARRQTSGAETGGGVVARLMRRVADKLTEVSAALLQYRHHRGALVSSFLVSCLTIVVMGLALQYWCLSLGYHLALIRMIAVAVILKIVGIVPVSIGNIGWSEAAVVVLLTWAGVTKTDALAVGLLQRMAGIALSLIGAGLQFWQPAAPAVAPVASAECDEPALDKGAGG